MNTIKLGLALALVCCIPACTSELHSAQALLGRIVPHAETEGDFYARASVEHVYAHAEAGARIGLYIHGIGDVWTICRGTEGFTCADDATDPGIAGEWVYDILIFEDGQGRRRLQLRPTPVALIAQVRQKLGVPTPVPHPGLLPRGDARLPDSPVMYLLEVEPEIVPPPPPPRTERL